MQIKLLVSAAAIALAAGVGSAAADENFGTLDGISAFDSLAGVQAIPLGTDEMAAIAAAHTVKYNLRKLTVEGEVTKGHEIHYVHGGKKAHRVIYTGVGGPKVYDNFTEQGFWADPFASTVLSIDIHESVADTSGP